jgi:transaldolase
MANALQQLAESGVAVWLDDLSRAQIHRGELARMVEHGRVVGVTTNPTIFAKAIGSGSGYEEQVHDLALRGTAVGEAVRLLTAWDVRAACDVLHPTAIRTRGRDGRVSIEVDPRIAQDAPRTAAEARGLWWLVDRPNLFIKIPATLAGLPAITETLAAGISVKGDSHLLGRALSRCARCLHEWAGATTRQRWIAARSGERRFVLREPD